MLPLNLGLEVSIPVVTEALLERHLSDSLKPCKFNFGVPLPSEP